MFSHPLGGDAALRLVSMGDAEMLFALVDANRVYLRQWLPWVAGTTHLDHTKRWIEGALRQYATNDGFEAGICLDGQIVGILGLNRINWANRSANIGYWLGEAFQGRGIVSMACQAVTSYAFSALNLNRVEIRAATMNHRSRAIPKRLNFEHEGTLREAEWLGDRFVDHEVYAMLAKHWLIPPVSQT
jgi:ribosomal-protein-serine acetyltransferase